MALGMVGTNMIRNRVEQYLESLPMGRRDEFLIVRHRAEVIFDLVQIDAP